MHSDYLNEDKICQMFQEDNDSAHKRQQVSLNFTVTSRESRCVPATIQQGSKTNKNLQSNLYNNMPSKNSISQASSTDSISVALNELDKFNNWFQNISRNNQKLIDDLSKITTYAQNHRSTILTIPDFHQLKKRCSKSVKNCNIKNQYLNVNMLQHTQFERECSNCKKNDQIIEAISQQYKSKVDQCLSYYQKIEKYQKYQKQFYNELQQGLRNTLLEGVQINLLRQQNENLNSQLINLKIQLDKSKLEKSSLMQKSTSFLKTKDLQKRLQPSSTNTNSKLFSNAKYSTNTMNPNDTMNRVQSIICFGDTSPNLDELIKFYGEEAQYMKNKCKDLVFQEEKKRNIKLNKQSRSIFSSQSNENKLLNLYRNIQTKLIQVKSYKEKCPILFTGSIKQRKTQDSQIISSSKYLQQNQQLKKFITILEKQICGLQNQKNNLEQTNADILSSYNKLNRTIKELQQKLINMKVEYKNLYEREKEQILHKKKLQLQLQEIKGSIRVYCRVRPRIGVQLKHKSIVIYGEDTKVIKQGKQYEFDYVFNDRSSQKDIYQQIKPLVERAYDNKSLCIFAYGQTGSGKTYTMHGDQKNPGIALNIINDLYYLVEKDRKVYDVSLSMSIVQIYKEQIRDLLGIGSKLQIKQNVSQGVYLEGCKPIRFQNKQQMLDVYKDGVTKRTTAEMEMNADSSRSHTIVTIYIQKINKKMKEYSSNLTKITLIDLAGAQRLTSSNPLIAKQTQFINKSLSCLVSVLSALKNKSQHIPYRDNKLTYLLKQSLSTKCNILTFINISSSQLNSQQTNNSLMFGVRARAIQRNILSKSKDTKQRDIKQLKENKQNDRNRRSSARLSIS